MADELMQIQNGTILKAIPMSLLNERAAQHNHSQSLATLNSRAGIAVGEALDIIDGKRWTRTNNTLADEWRLFRLMAAEIGGKADG